jgi:crotonobetainyl-CoA:carnitine CoA-transferase CaiB-like acyl-CoA transferase
MVEPIVSQACDEHELAYAKMAAILTSVGAADIEHGVTFQGHGRVIASPHKLAAAAAAIIGSYAASIIELARHRCGIDQTCTIDFEDAVRALNSTLYLRQNGQSIGLGRSNFIMEPLIVGFYPTSDGHWIKLGGTQAAHRNKTLRILGAQNSREEIAAATIRFKAIELEDEINAAGAVAAVARTQEQWLKTAHGHTVAASPLVRITRLADGPIVPFEPADSPALGVRVLELTQVLAGPVVGRCLAEQGADVLRVARMDRFDPTYMLIDTGFGKRSTHLDLGDAEQRETFLALAHDADVFVRSFRPGTLEVFGLGREELSAKFPGLVQVQVTCYGDGPWHARGGYDPNAQACTGIAFTEAVGGVPQSPISYLLADYLTGYLGALGAIQALLRRAREGGSYLVEVSLTRTCMFVQEFGLFNQGDIGSLPRSLPAAGDAVEEMDSPYGQLTYLKSPIRLSETPQCYRIPPTPFGSSRPCWS